MLSICDFREDRRGKL